MYKHILNCPNVPAALKRTIGAVRKTHSQQCSSLPFGSQRRFFKKLFSRLNDVPLEVVTADTDLDFVKTLHKCAFVQTTTSVNTYWQCTKCRMVPFDYRAPGSLFFSPPSVNVLKKHFDECQKDDIHWDSITLSMKNLEKKYRSVTPLVKIESFSEMVRSVVGREVEIISTFMIKLGREGQLPAQSLNRGIWRRLPTEVDLNMVQNHFSVLQKELDLTPGNLADFPDFLQFLQLLSCNVQIPLTNDKVEEEKNSTTIVVDQQKELPVAKTRAGIDSKLPKGFDQENNLEKGLEVEGKLDTQESLKIISVRETTSEILKLNSDTNNYSEEAELTIHSTQIGGQQEIATLNSNPSLMVETNELTVDQGREIMDYTEAGQFDDA